MDDIRQGVIDTTMAIPTDTIINGAPANVLRPVPDLIRILRDEIFLPGGPLSANGAGRPTDAHASRRSKGADRKQHLQSRAGGSAPPSS